ncbi:unnamed protein product [Cuscuta campestris]|uniref:R3H domain-containing protein n=1 Tax=Cuscuta campestris TaxID=132261 RepID=A0A484MWN5_9ASTE|nr:unnamed protein product [Cuscuta campestris]
MQVEKLAFTVKDNLSCKHLILSMEEAFINFLQDDTSSNGVLELKPMDPYCRHLIHRLSDIFGLSHHSEGEGDDRHLIVERCPETSIPPVLVRDVLREHGEVLSPWNFEILPRKQESAGSPQAGNPEAFIFTSLEEKEAAYLAARQRIFSTDGNTAGSMTERPKTDLEVARRMIGHALGQQIRPSSGGEVTDGVKEEEGTETKMPMGNTSAGTLSEVKSEGKMGNEDLIKEQHMGAAKRLFANALGVPRDGNLPKRSIGSKQTKAFRVKDEEPNQTKAFGVKEEEGTLSDC